MHIKTGTFVRGLLGAAVISTVMFGPLGYGEEPVREYYENGKLKSEVGYKNGRFNGPTKEYYANGKLKLEGFSKDGEPEGLIKTYYESGRIETEVVYKDGEPVAGTFKEYDEKGNLKP